MASVLEQEVSQLFSYLDTQKKGEPQNPAFAVTDIDQLLEERPPPRPPLPVQYRASATVEAVSQQPQRAQPVGSGAASIATTGSQSIESEVDKLTDILMKNLEFAAEKDFEGLCRGVCGCVGVIAILVCCGMTGICHKCDDKVIGSENGCQAMGKLYHRTCFVCKVCSKGTVLTVLCFHC